jgi:cyclopropane-fatty-acyl-phospholipid synthase
MSSDSAAFDGRGRVDDLEVAARDLNLIDLAPAVGTRAPAPSYFRRMMLPMLADMRQGRLRMEFPDGQETRFGAADAGEGFLPVPAPAPPIPRAAVIRVRREAFFRRCALYGDIGFAEAYMDGDWETPDLAAVIAWFILNIENAPTLSGSSRARSLALDLFRAGNRLGHLLRSNSRANARRNIGEHYDLSNEFFALFLDPTMMYSAAKWSRADLTLEEAQREKNDALCRKLRLRPADHVLEIGTGWGGWSIHAARNYGCRVTSVTISRQQFELARERVAAAGLDDRVNVELRDYRELAGRYDKLVSIEMMEAIGHRYLPRFCDGAARLLKPEGAMALQFITCPDARYEELRRGVDFIQKHVFPGSLLLSLNRVNGLMAKAGGFMLGGLEDLGPDYARTLREWRDRFGARLQEVRALGFDERFLRKWNYYLEYCEAAFALRNISVVQAVYTRPNHLGS